MLNNAGAAGLERLLTGNLYSLTGSPGGLLLPESVAPRIISVNDALLEKLKREPQTIYDLTSRKFEEIVADLLSDMGIEVELTPETRDGGCDILAYIDAGVGKMLCLVEAKRYRENFKVGVGVVRTLYGTLCDAHASSAMLVTTSSFSSVAQEFANQYEWRLKLRDYGNLVRWIEGYKTGPRSPFVG